MTVGEAFDSLTQEEKELVYSMVADINNDPDITECGLYEYDISFLSHAHQRIVVYHLLSWVIDNKNKHKKKG